MGTTWETILLGGRYRHILYTPWLFPPLPSSKSTSIWNFTVALLVKQTSFRAFNGLSCLRPTLLPFFATCADQILLPCDHSSTGSKDSHPEFLLRYQTRKIRPLNQSMGEIFGGFRSWAGDQLADNRLSGKCILYAWQVCRYEEPATAGIRREIAMPNP